MAYEESPCRALILSVFYCAMLDAVQERDMKLRREAIAFLKKKNPLFSFYSSLIGITPEYMEENIHKKLKDALTSKDAPWLHLKV